MLKNNPLLHMIVAEIQNSVLITLSKHNAKTAFESEIKRMISKEIVSILTTLWRELHHTGIKTVVD